jgi:hypothetical protein
METLRKIGRGAFGGAVPPLFTSTLASQAFAQTCVPPPQGILAWWPLEEASGTDAEDGTGNHPGIQVNGQPRLQETSMEPCTLRDHHKSACQMTTRGHLAQMILASNSGRRLCG